MSNALASCIGIVVGALFQYFFTRHLEGQRHHREMRTRAYTDYLKCISELANISHELASLKELRMRTADAKSRICLYGSAQAIAAFAEFERLGATMNTQEQRLAFTRMVATMRNDSSSGSAVPLPDLEAILLGVERRE